MSYRLKLVYAKWQDFQIRMGEAVLEAFPFLRPPLERLLDWLSRWLGGPLAKLEAKYGPGTSGALGAMTGLVIVALYIALAEGWLL